MKIDEVIEELKSIRRFQGNLDCVIELGGDSNSDPRIIIVGELSVEERLFTDEEGKLDYIKSVLFML